MKKSKLIRFHQEIFFNLVFGFFNFRDYLMDEKYWKTTDSKRKNKAATVFEDSFKTIAFD